MMASSIISSNTERSRDLARRKKQKKNIKQNQSQPKWQSQAQQQIYSTKLRQALTRVNPGRGKSVREAADRALAVTAKGRTRWSRAILMNRLKIKFRKQKRQRTSAVSRSKKPGVSVLRFKGKGKGKAVPSLQRKTRFLGRLVPGCKKEPLPVILEEAIDYIPALEMQVRAMTALFNLLSASSSASTSG